VLALQVSFSPQKRLFDTDNGPAIGWDLSIRDPYILNEPSKCLDTKLRQSAYWFLGISYDDRPLCNASTVSDNDY